MTVSRSNEAMSPRSQLPLIPLILFLFQVGKAAAWEPVEIPSAEISSPSWLRCRIQVPDRLVVPEANNPRDLWRSSTMLVLADLPHGGEVILNGASIIATGAIPRGESRRFKIPKDLLVAKQFNTLVIRLERGALTRAPMLIDYFNELQLGPSWELSRTPPAPSDLNAVADRPSIAAYLEGEFRLSATPLDSTLDPIPGERVSPADSLAAIETDDDLIVEQLLHEPEAAPNPHTSASMPAGACGCRSTASTLTRKACACSAAIRYYRSKYDRIPPAPPYHDQGADIISVHETATERGL